MAHTLSAKKSIRQNRTRKAINRWRKRRIHDAVRAFDRTLQAKNTESASEAYRGVCSILDKVACSGTIHRNNAARRKSRLARRLNSYLAASATN
jgi:small subunit ribosomal protein S20